MSAESLYRTVHQYNRNPIPVADMEKLCEIARDYRKVKNVVYQRYGGIKSLSKLYPGYTIQNEMTESGLRSQLAMPSVYFYLAIFDALGDIKTQWTLIRSAISEEIKKSGVFTPEESHYLRFVLKNDACLNGILLEKEMELQSGLEEQYQVLAQGLEIRKLHNYLRRQVRKRLHKPHTEITDGFSISARAYRYGDHGIYISVKEKRKRIFVLLTDNNRYQKQMYIRLFPETGNLEIKVPVEVTIRHCEHNYRTIGLAQGMRAMLTTDSGHVYGEKYEEFQKALEEHIRSGNSYYMRNRDKNPGRKKYFAKKERLEAALHTYINQELNRFFREEVPETIYMPKLPQGTKAGVNKNRNRSAGLWQRGYIRRRMKQKASERAIQLEEIFAKGISSECSVCGKTGKRENGTFYCDFCRESMPERMNAARNALRRGLILQEEKKLQGHNKETADK